MLEIDDASSGDDESDEGDSEGDDFEEDAEFAAERRRMKGKDRAEEPRTEEAERVEDPRNTHKGTHRERPVRTRDSGYTNARPTRDAPVTKEQHRPSTRDRTESRPADPTPEGPSLRELKRQAYLGPPVDAQRVIAHPARSRKVQSKPVPPQDDGKTGGPRRPVVSAGEGKVQNAGRRTSAVGGYAGAGARRRDGRPNLNARMGVLLEQIQRSK